MGKEIRKTLLIKGIEYKDTTKVHANGDVVKVNEQLIKCIDNEGGTQFTLKMPKMPDGFAGFKEKQVIDMVITSSQTSIDDFSGWKEKEKKTDEK